MTNGDRIRQMTDEELCIALRCPYLFIEKYEVPPCIGEPDCEHCIPFWLKQEAEE